MFGNLSDCELPRCANSVLRCMFRTHRGRGGRVHSPPQITLRSSGVTKMSSLQDYDDAGCKPARIIARGKVRGTSTATSGIRMSRVFGRGASVACTEAHHLTDAKGENHN